MAGDKAKPSGVDYGDIRTFLDVAKLESYLEKQIEGLKLPLQVKQFKFGQSNPTYFVTDGRGVRYVLRKKPPGKLVSKTAHAVEREYRVIKAIGEVNAGVAVPKVYLLCSDESVLGTPFYVMEFLDGRIFTDVTLPEIKDKEERQKLWFSLVRTLARLHKLDPVRIGLRDYGSMSDFYPRQIKSLSKVSQDQAKVKDKETGEEVGEIQDLNSLMRWYSNNAPKGETTIVHGDFKMDNIVFHKTKPEVIGVLDWELSTLGHPFSDLANLLQPFYLPTEASAPGAPAGLRGLPASELPIPDAETLMKLYCSELGRSYPLEGWPAAVSFAFFRLSVIMQGIAARSAVGQASSERAKVYAVMFVPVGLLAIDTIRELTGKEMDYIEEGDDADGSKAKL